jgi:hypothetical protein
VALTDVSHDVLHRFDFIGIIPHLEFGLSRRLANYLLLGEVFSLLLHLLLPRPKLKLNFLLYFENFRAWE